VLFRSNLFGEINHVKVPIDDAIRGVYRQCLNIFKIHFVPFVFGNYIITILVFEPGAGAPSALTLGDSDLEVLTLFGRLIQPVGVTGAL
jgi:hypothetical protein